MQQLKITQSVTARTQTVSQYLSDINRYPMLTPDEEGKLARLIREGSASIPASLSRKMFWMSCTNACSHEIVVTAFDWQVFSPCLFVLFDIFEKQFV